MYCVPYLGLYIIIFDCQMRCSPEFPFLCASAHSKLFWGDAFIFLKVLYKMAAIGKPCFLTDIIEVKIGKDQKFLCFVKPHLFYVLFTAHAVLLTEFFCKAGIA